MQNFDVTITFLACRFFAGVAHSFTGSAEDRDKLLSFSNLYIGKYPSYPRKLLHASIICSLDFR